MTTVHLWLVVGGAVLTFLLYHMRKYLTWPVALHYLRYKIILTVIIVTIVPSNFIIFTNHLGIIQILIPHLKEDIS